MINGSINNAIHGLVYLHFPDGTEFQLQVHGDRLPLRLLAEVDQLAVVDSGWLKLRQHIEFLYPSDQLELPARCYVESLPTLNLHQWVYRPPVLEGEHCCQCM